MTPATTARAALDHRLALVDADRRAGPHARGSTGTSCGHCQVADERAFFSLALSARVSVSRHT